MTYAPPPRISVKSKRFKGKAVLVKLACAASGSSCRGKVTLRYTETVIKHHKKHKIAVVIASKQLFDRLRPLPRQSRRRLNAPARGC